MQNISETKRIKEKALFIYNNSGLIYSKLVNDNTSVETIYYLERIIFSGDTLKELDDICTYILNKKGINVTSVSCYNSAINIIFKLCHIKNAEAIETCESINFRNELRKYTKYFKFNENDDLRLNDEHIHMNYEKVKTIQKKK